MANSIQDRVTRLLLRWRYRPDLFAKECIGCKPSSQQEEGLRLIGRVAESKHKAFHGEKLTKEQQKLAKKRGISIRSGHGTGKDAMLSWVYLWLLTCYKDPRGLVTAPTSRQLRSILWSEFSKWIKHSASQNEENKSILSENLIYQSEKIYLKGSKETTFVEARTANIKGSEEEQGEALAGQHSDYMILSIDEASGVPRGVFQPIEGAMTGKMNFAILIGNPTRGSGYFYDTHNNDRDRWVCLHWNSEDSEITNKLELEEDRKKYGSGSNWYRIRRLGEFPLADPDCLIPLELIMNAVDREVTPDEDLASVIGVDPAWSGNDSTAIVVRRGAEILDMKRIKGYEPMGVAGEVAIMINDYDPAQVFVDSIGIGAGIYSRLKELGHRAVSVNVARTAQEENRFHRVRDELWWRVKEAFDGGNIKIPNDDVLIGELSTIKVDEPDSKGRTQIESKKQIRRDGRKSPDSADALCLTYYYRDKVYSKTILEKYAGNETYESANDELSWMTA
jgi:hypothetical protein